MTQENTLPSLLTRKLLEGEGGHRGPATKKTFLRRSPFQYVSRREILERFHIARSNKKHLRTSERNKTKRQAQKVNQGGGHPRGKGK